MAHQIGFVDNTGSEGLAHWQMLLTIKTLAEANGWTTQRYLNPTDGSNRELILKGVGLSGTEAIYIGFRSYHDATADYYNLTCAAFTGYVAANAFTAQPGYVEYGICAHNQRVDYWLLANAQRICFALKIGAPSVYEVAYVGKFFAYATPGQYPYPMACLGTLPSGTPTTRYSDTSDNHRSGIKGVLPYPSGPSGVLPCGRIRDVSGNWLYNRTFPYTDDQMRSPQLRRDSGGYYTAIPIALLFGSTDSASSVGAPPTFDKDYKNVMGELDGIRYVSGFNRTSEDSAVIGGNTNIVIGDAFRTGVGDYFLLEMN